MSDKINPWLLRRPSSPSSPVPGTGVPAQPTFGPPVPQRGGRVPGSPFPLPHREQHGRSASLWVLGVHGGAGESAIASLRPDWAAADHALPAGAAGPGRLLLTCRSQVRGLLAAQAMATQWAGGGLHGLELIGLVIIADAPGKLPQPVRELAGVVAGGVPRCWHLPWSEAWRMGDSPPIGELPRPFRRLLADLDALTAPPTNHDLVTLEGIHHASPRDDHPVRPAFPHPRPAADPR